MRATEKVIDCLNSLLRGELAATETYQLALAKVDAEPGAADLRRLRAEHREAANTLRKHIHKHGGKPVQGSGAAWAKTVEGMAKLFGNTAALKALKEGEEHGVKAYEKAVEDEELPADSKALIRTQLLARTRTHIPVLDRLMEAQ